ncbi:MAG: hypothetical protein U1D36_04505 [Hydrogenophaga sp.]|uniref:hypothetical protein n=1 Tax=Hydrogenophaga sp. TaxID=1904254 RepID=UPI00272720BA|nr:hypothetical protein [Hydrogenophaga sp.]MDO9251678.1 hypothetical protein [Hydrogenophaga sp.]MDP2405567.1 hypothetical protein [Hydrogenophaga sp.]MDZ4173722.1 hypothetical protein [Hydrogenophaga sp.]
MGHTEPGSVVVMVVRLAGIEPTTLGFGGQKTIWLLDGFDRYPVVLMRHFLSVFIVGTLVAILPCKWTDGFN